MDKIKLYKNIGLVVWIIVTVILAYLVVKPNVNPINDTVANARIDSLISENKVLMKNVSDRDIENASSKKIISYYEFKSDSFLNVISKTPTKYNGDYTKAHNATANILVSEFTNVFADNNIK